VALHCCSRSDEELQWVGGGGGWRCWAGKQPAIYVQRITRNKTLLTILALKSTQVLYRPRYRLQKHTGLYTEGPRSISRLATKDCNRLTQLSDNCPNRAPNRPRSLPSTSLPLDTDQQSSPDCPSPDCSEVPLRPSRCSAVNVVAIPGTKLSCSACRCAHVSFRHHCTSFRPFS
jgi:hypothetical protein